MFNLSRGFEMTYTLFLETILSPKININVSNKAENLIQEFVKELTELYDERIMLSGVH
jgi:type II restriction/modification system DNA methylase subunit YeeA